MDKTQADLAQGISTLLAAAHAGSATRAALELGTTAATVLRRLETLEGALGTQLFDRTSAGLVPTPALGLVLPWAEQAVNALARMKDELTGLERSPVGTVRIALLPGLSRYILAQGIEQFHKRYPEITLEFHPASAVVDLARREADIALRTIRPEAGALVAKQLSTFRLAVMAAPSLLSKIAGQKLKDLPWLTFADDLSSTPEALWLRTYVPSARIVLRASDMQTLLFAAQAGLGALVVAEPLGRVTAGLVEIAAPAPLPEGTLWLVTHHALRPIPRVAAVWEWLIEAFGAAALSV